VTDLFAPLTGVVRGDSSPQAINRAVSHLASPAGIFSIRSRAPEPIGTHPIELALTSVEEEEIFRAWFHTQLGACVPFWLPSYHQDLVLAAPVADIDTTITIRFMAYTARYYAADNRKVLAFVRADGTLIKRDVASAVDNGDGTETITLNEALGEDWEQTFGNGICFCWYGRLADDKAEIQWHGQHVSTVSLSMVELRNPPLGGSATAGPVDGSFPDPV
jgi:hypothetical protein